MDPVTLAGLILSQTGLGDWLRTKMGGTIGDSAAGKIIDMAKAVTGATLPNEITTRLQADATLTNELRVKLIDNEQEIIRLEFADRADARAMQIAALNQADIFSKRFVYYFIAVWSLFVMVYIGFITFAAIPAANVRFADTILGVVLGTVLAGMFQFLLGGTFSGKTKDSSISALAAAIKSR